MRASDHSDEAAADGREGRPPAPGPTAAAPWRPYDRPRLARFGRLVDVTLGGSPGVGDSGGGVLIQNPLMGP